MHERIHVTDLAKSYGALRAVDGVSFTVAAGETFGLLGPNGAGKTTTLSLLSGLLAPDTGRIAVDGGDPADPAVRRRLGAAPQALAVYDDLTGEENVAFFARLYGLGGGRLAERVAWALDLAGLTDRRKGRVETYSGGMKRRLNLACALVHDPAVIYLDEPTVGVDPQSRDHILGAITRLKDEGRTVLYTTHYMEEAERLCDRVAIMDQGRILALDTVERLVHAHGGRAVVHAELTAPPPPTHCFAPHADGATLRIECDRPFEVVAQLAGDGVTVRTLGVETADLESVFLSLTGRRLRDE